MNIILYIQRSPKVRVIRGAVIAGLGAGVVIALQEVGKIDFGAWTPVVVAGASILINAINVWLTSKKAQQ
jgi:hypothetical protein